MTLGLEGTRTCAECGRSYYKKYGMSNAKCTACISRYKYHKNKDKMREYHRNWARNERKSNYSRVLERERRNSASRDLIKERWGLSPETVDFWLAKQNFECAICTKPLERRGKANGLHIDHDHRTGQVRGFLCNLCNSGLGHFKDSIKLLDRAKGYLACPPIDEKPPRLPPGRRELRPFNPEGIA